MWVSLFLTIIQKPLYLQSSNSSTGVKQLCLGETCGVLIWKWAQPVLQYVPGWLPFVLPHLSELLHCAKLVFKLAKILAVFPSLWAVGFEIVLYLASLQVKLGRLMLLPFSCEVATCSWLSLGEYYAMFVSFIVKTNTTTRRQPNTRKCWRLTLKKKKNLSFTRTLYLLLSVYLAF